MSSVLPLVPLVKRPAPVASCRVCQRELIPEADGETPTVCPDCTKWTTKTYDRNALITQWLPWIRRQGRRYAECALMDADDLAQEIAIKAMTYFYSYNPARGSLPTWLIHVARSTARQLRARALARIRGGRVVLGRAGDAVERMAVSREPDAAKAAALAETQNQVRAALVDLTPLQRRAVRMRFGIDGQASCPADPRVTREAASDAFFCGMAKLGKALARTNGAVAQRFILKKKSVYRPPTGQCRHCSKARANRSRGLCWSCFYQPAIRDLYPVTSKFAPRSARSCSPLN